MPPVTRLLRTLAAAAAATSLVLAGGSGQLALANGTGDLYSAASTAVLELNTGTSAIDHAICLSEAPSSSASPSASAAATPAGSVTPGTCPATAIANPKQLAFSADTAASSLYLAVANGTPDVYRIGIENLDVRAPVTMPANVTAIAHPKGSSLYVATTGSSTLLFLGDGETKPVDGAPMAKGAPDILAADPRDTHVVAAKAGEAWVAVVDPSGIVNYPQLPDGGKVVAAAVARDEGAAWIATTGPNALYRIDLVKHTVVYKTALPDVPTGVAALDHYAVVSIGAKLYKVERDSAALWATASGDVAGLASDLDAGYVYVATASTITARAVTTPTTAASTIQLAAAPAAMAPVPNRASNLPSVHGASPASAGGAAATTRPRTTRAPQTDTVSDLIAGRSVDATTVLLGLGALVVAVTVGSHVLIKRLVRE